MAPQEQIQKSLRPCNKKQKASKNPRKGPGIARLETILEEKNLNENQRFVELPPLSFQSIPWRYCYYPRRLPRNPISAQMLSPSTNATHLVQNYVSKNQQYGKLEENSKSLIRQPFQMKELSSIQNSVWRGKENIAPASMKEKQPSLPFSLMGSPSHERLECGLAEIQNSRIYHSSNDTSHSEHSKRNTGKEEMPHPATSNGGFLTLSPPLPWMQRSIQKPQQKPQSDEGSMQQPTGEEALNVGIDKLDLNLKL